MKYIGIATKTREGLNIEDVMIYLQDYLEDNSCVRGLIFKKNGIEVYYTTEDGADGKVFIDEGHLNCEEYTFLPQVAREGIKPYCKYCTMDSSCWNWIRLNQPEEIEEQDIELFKNWSEEVYENELHKWVERKKHFEGGMSYGL